MRQETLILKNLIHNEEYARKVLPFIKDEYFQNESERRLFKIIDDYIKEYNVCPSIEGIQIKISDVRITENQLEDTNHIIEDLKKCNKESMQWLVDETESFCKNRAIFNAISKSIEIMDGIDKTRTSDAIPSLLQDALGVSFDPSVGHDYFDDASARFDYYQNVLTKIPFDIELLNVITKGGLSIKSLIVLLAGCIHPDTKVEIMVDDKITTNKISDIYLLYKEGKEVFINSPDGFVKVKRFIKKGDFEEYCLNLDDGRSVRCNGDHLFETALGWQFAKDLALLNEEQHFLTDNNSYSLGFVNKIEGSIIPIVDIEVDHENHRYYANGISSHNTGVGKSLGMCHIASSCLSMGKDVLYITLEMAEEKIAQRIDANLLDIDIAKIETTPKEILDNKINALKNKTAGKLVVKEYAPSAAHAGHFRILLNELKLKKKFIPSIIFIDYLGICASQRYKNNGSVGSYHYVKAVSEELRALGVEFGVPVVTASQVNRCLFIDTQVQTVGGKKAIKDVKVGDLILTSGNNYTTVEKVFDIEEQECFEIKTSKNTVICSKKHVFPTLKGEYSIEDGLEVEDRLFCYEYDGDKRTHVEYIDKIISIKSVGVKQTIDITVSNDHLFYANNILTHNSGYGSSDIEMTDTSESFGLNFTADLILSLISNDELSKSNLIMIKQLKNRYNDINIHNKFIVGIDRSKMRLYDVDKTHTDKLSGPKIDVSPSQNTFGQKQDRSGFSKIKV